MRVPEILRDVFETNVQSGWVALNTKHPNLLRGYRTRRIGKLTPDLDLQITIGATQQGQAIGLNRTIEEILRAEGLEVLDRSTTSGSRGYDAPYPTVRFGDIKHAALERVCFRIEGAAFQGGRT